MTEPARCNHQHIITDHFTNKDELYMRTICVFLQDDPHGWGNLTVHASHKQGIWERASFSTSANITVERLPFLQEAIGIATTWLETNPETWKQMGELANYRYETMGGKAVYDAANKASEEYYNSKRKKRK